MRITGHVVVRMLEGCDKAGHATLSSCEVVEYEIFEGDEVEDLMCWSYPDSIIEELSGEGYKKGLFGVDFIVNLSYHTDYYGETDCDVEYSKFEVTELEEVVAWDVPLR